MAATGVTIDPDISGRDNPTPMLCLVAQLSVLFGTHSTGGGMRDLRRDGAAEADPLHAFRRRHSVRASSGWTTNAGAVHDNSPGASTYKRRLVQSGEFLVCQFLETSSKFVHVNLIACKLIHRSAFHCFTRSIDLRDEFQARTLPFVRSPENPNI